MIRIGWLSALLLVGASPEPVGLPELPRPDFTSNTFILMIGKSSKFETTADAEAGEVYSKMGPSRLYIRLWYDGPCAKEIHEKYHGHRPWFWNSPLDAQNAAYTSDDRRMRQWDAQGEVVTDEQKKAGNPADADLTPSGYAKEAYDGMLDMARREAKNYLDARNRGDRTFFLCGPNEFEYVFFDRDNFSTDYSPFAVAELRDWLSHRGEFAKGGRFEGQGRKGGEAFADDPSPASPRGGNPSFNAVHRTAFATWKLQYWDLDEFPGSLPKSAKPMPGPGERGFIAGGFDAPRKVGAGLWERFQNRDPKDPGYRQWRIHQSLRDMFKVIREAGVPRGEVWSRQRGMHSHRVDYWQGKAGPVNAGWMAMTPDNLAGYNQYNLRPGQDRERLDHITEEAKKAGTQVGILEWHPSLGVNPNFKETEYAADLEAFWNAGVRIVGCRNWLGNNSEKSQGIDSGAMRIRDTPFEPAIKKFLATRPDVPFGSNPRQPYAPPRVRGVSLKGATVAWKNELWEGETFPYGAWADFGSFEIATFEDIDEKGAPKSPTAMGSAKGASHEVRADLLKKFIAVRAVAKSRAASAWSEAVPVEK